MWVQGLILVAAEQPPDSGTSEALIVAAGTVLVALLGGIASVAIAVINARNRTSAPSETPQVHATDLVRRADDNDERDDVQDRRHNRTESNLDRLTDRVERLEGHHDRHDPGWRSA